MKLTLELPQLEAALSDGSSPNDLLPSRAGDRLGGQLGKRFMAMIYEQINSGSYQPTTCQPIAVPKSNFSTRVAALMTIEDRIIYTALVHRIRDRVEKYLLPKEVVLFPRGVDDGTHWPEFESSPQILGQPYIVLADVAGFYESIDHEILKDNLLRATGQSDEANQLCEFLAQIMGQKRGIPQGLNASDVLASLYLSSVDAAMIREGFDYFRHGDDIRISTVDYPEGKRALYYLQERLRELKLLPNTSKCKVLKSSTYEHQQNEVEATKARYGDKVKRDLAESLLEEDDDFIEDILGEEMVWSWYHNSMSQEEILAQVKESMSPNALYIAKAILTDLLGGDALENLPISNEAFHQLLVSLFTILKASKDGFAVKYCPKLLQNHPEKSDIVTSYLKSLPTDENNNVDKALQFALSTENYKTGWELSNALEVVVSRKYASAQTGKLLHTIAQSEDVEWIARIEAHLALASISSLTQEQAMRSWRIAPVIFRGEIVKAISMMKQEDWAKKFLSTLQDPGHIAILHNQT